MPSRPVCSLIAGHGPYRSEFGPVPFPTLLHNDPGNKPLAHEVLDVQLVISGEPGLQASLEDLPGLGPDLYGPVFSEGRVVKEGETFVLTFGNHQFELELRAVVSNVLSGENLQLMLAGLHHLATASPYFAHFF